MRPDDPTCHNSARPHHPVAAHLHADYTYAFALVSRQPHRGRLPGQLPFAVLALMQQRNLDEQVKGDLDRACEAGRFDASLFTPEQLAAGRQQMERSAQASQNLLASYGLL